MTFLRRRVCAIALFTFVLGGSLVAKTTFSSVWKAQNASSVTFRGKKVAALVIDSDQSLRISGEEALVRELNQLGIEGVAAYRMAPKEELQSAERAKGWFERANVAGVVAFRAINDDRRRTYQPATWTTTYYQSFWGYYGNSWSAVYEPGYVRNERFVSLETLIFDVPGNALVWAGMSTTENPKTGQAVVADVVKQAVKEMQKQGLASAQPKSK
jgi:hypothetical protein